MVDIANLAGVFVRLPSGRVTGLHGKQVLAAEEDSIRIKLSDNVEFDQGIVIKSGNWLPVYSPKALSFLKSVPMYPQNGQLTVQSVRRGHRVPTFYCDVVFANSVLRWYKRVGNFVSPPGLVYVTVTESSYFSGKEFKAMSVLPAIVFEGEGDAVLWSLTAMESGGDLFAEPKNEREKAVIQTVNEILRNHENYFG